MVRTTKNLAVILAGGAGQRMCSKDRPKQFLMVHGKPVIIHTLEQFERHPDIDGMVVSCIPEWMEYMRDLIARYHLKKIKKIVPGGPTRQLSSYNCLTAAADLYGREGNIVLIHDGVRPLIDRQTITDNILSVKQWGSAITCAPVTETVVLINKDGELTDVPDKNQSALAKSPQSFRLQDILSVQEQAIREGHDNVVDCCTLMRMYGKPLHIVNGSKSNIKITTAEDFYMLRAVMDARENSQIPEV